MRAQDTKTIQGSEHVCWCRTGLDQLQIGSKAGVDACRQVLVQCRWGSQRAPGKVIEMFPLEQMHGLRGVIALHSAGQLADAAPGAKTIALLQHHDGIPNG